MLTDIENGPREMEIMELSKVTSLVWGGFLHSCGIAPQNLGDIRMERKVGSSVPLHSSSI